MDIPPGPAQRSSFHLVPGGALRVLVLLLALAAFARALDHASDCPASRGLKWKEPGFCSGTSLLLADGLLFARCYQTLRLVDATPEGYRLRGEIHTHDVWKPTYNLTDIVSPVLAHGRLYVRTPEELLCYDVAASR
jgi:hypothetical protein